MNHYHIYKAFLWQHPRLYQVAETRQLKEEEEVLMWRAANAMQQLYSEIMQTREAQGYWATNLQLTVLQRPPEEMLWSMVIFCCQNAFSCGEN